MKDLERKVANLFMDNVALKTKLEASREVETQQQEEITHLKEQLVQALSAQVNMHLWDLNCVYHFSAHFLCTTGHSYSRAVTVKDQGVRAGGEDYGAGRNEI